MEQHDRFKRIFLLGICLCLTAFLSGCGTTIQHVPSQNLNKVSVAKPVAIMVADIGDERVGESIDRIGQGASYWLPVSFYARDHEGKKLPVSFYIAESLSTDLAKIGYTTKLANDGFSRLPLSLDKARELALTEGVDYLVTTKVTDGKTNFWGFIVIPFMEPVWTRIAYTSDLMDIKADGRVFPLSKSHRETEWYFGKITIFDALFDAGLFGRRWHRKAWGETVVSDALAETTLEISEKIQSAQPVRDI